MRVHLRLPHKFHRGDELPADLHGATIAKIGTTDSDRESGEFVLEYVPAGAKRSRTLVLLFNERGMWIDELTDESAILGGLSRFLHGRQR